MTFEAAMNTTLPFTCFRDLIDDREIWLPVDSKGDYMPEYLNEEEQVIIALRGV